MTRDKTRPLKSKNDKTMPAIYLHLVGGTLSAWRLASHPQPIMTLFIVKMMQIPTITTTRLIMNFFIAWTLDCRCLGRLNCKQY